MRGFDQLKSALLGIFFAAGFVSAAEHANYSCVTNNGSITITKYRGPGGVVIVPESINGLPVTSIGANDTHEKRGRGISTAPADMSAAWLPAALQVFEPTQAITKIRMPATLTGIGDFAFMGCREMTHCIIPESVESIGDYAFHGCSELKELYIPDGVTKLGHRAISSCLELTELRLGPQLTSMGDAAFVYCGSLTNVHIPRGLSSIGQGAWAECYSLSNISVDVENSHFTVKDGILYDASFKRLILCPPKLSLDPQNITDTERHLVFSEFSYVESGDYDLFEDPSLNRYSKTSFPLTLPDSVTSIEPWAFSSCDHLTSINLPEQITTIGDGAFFSCGKLLSIHLPNHVRTIGSAAFGGCRDLEAIHLPISCLHIGEDAFSYCDSLTNITVDARNPSYSSLDGILYDKNKTKLIKCPRSKSGSVIIPPTVTTIQSGAFRDCAKITNILNAERVEQIGESAFQGCHWLDRIDLGGDLASIGPRAFKDCRRLKEIYLPENVTNIPARAFEDCRALKRVRIEDSITYIGQYAFKNCLSLTNAPLPQSVTYIGKGAFIKCARLIRITIPIGVTTIAPDTFKGCVRLRHLSIPRGVTAIGEGAFMNCDVLRAVELPSVLTRIEPNTFRDCHTLKRVNIPDGIEIIGERAFADCYSLEIVVFPSSVTQIGERAFSSCDLRNINLPDGITTIDKMTFRGSRNLHRVTIPASVTNIADAAFAFCGNETKIFEFAGDAPTDATNVFNETHGVECHYWQGAGGWSNAITGCRTVARDPAYPDFIYVASSGEITIKGYSGTNENPIIPSHISGQPVTKVESLTLNKKSLITSVTLPETVTKIDNLWMYSTLSHIQVACDNPVYSSENGMLFNKDKTMLIACPPAKKPPFKLPDTLQQLESRAFAHCGNLIDIEIPTGVESIPSGAFSSCGNLRSVALPDSITTIESSAFLDCSNLTNLAIPTAVKEIGPGAFSGCTNFTNFFLPAAIERIGSRAFRSCSGLTKIEIPAGVKTIEGYLFAGCSKLEEVSIPASVTSIGNQAFTGCEQLAHIEIPESVTNITHWPFTGCDRLTELTFPDGVTELSEAVFAHCANLERITFSPIHPTYSSVGGLWFNKDQTRLIYCPNGIKGEIEIPDSVTNISRSAFSREELLTSIFVDPASALYATVDGILYDKNLTTLRHCPHGVNGKINIPSSVTNIPHGTFFKCSALGEIRVEEGNEVYSSYDGVLYDRYQSELITCPEGKYGEIKIPVSMVEYPLNALSQNTNLTAITVDPMHTAYSDLDGVLYNIDRTKLLLCPRGKVGTIYLPATVSAIAMGALDGCTELDAIMVNEHCKNFTSLNGVLFYRLKSGLIKCPAGKKGRFIIPDTVDRIHFRAFAGCNRLTEIKLGENVEVINAYAFEGCTGLSLIHIPESMSTIGNSAFKDCAEDLQFILEGIPRVSIHDDLFRDVTLF